jgi:hypothetical protein
VRPVCVVATDRTIVLRTKRLLVIDTDHGKIGKPEAM